MSLYGPRPEYTPFVSGLMLIGLVYASGHLSGAHFNPAVTIAVFLRGRISLNSVPLYILSQLLAAGMASFICILLCGNKTIPIIEISNLTLEAILAEFFGVFVIVYVFLNVATSKNTMGNDFYGISYGLTLTACMLALNQISGAAFNPAVSISFSVVKIASFSNLWIYWLGEISGACLAALVFLFLNGKN